MRPYGHPRGFQYEQDMYYYVVLALSNDHGTCILNGVDLQSMCDSSSHNILQTTKQVVVDRVSLYEENIHTVFEMAETEGALPRALASYIH